jgi:hypothetical protein
MILAAFLVALLAAPPFAGAQEDTKEQMSQAVTAKKQVQEQVQLAKEQAQASRETFSQALASIRQENFNQAIATAEGIQSVPEPEEMVAGGPGEAPAEEVAAGGPGAVVPPVPDFAPAEVDAPSGVGSTE